MDYFWQKIGMLVAILVSSVVMGLLPMGLKKVSPAIKKRLLSYGNAFAGGVFFAIGFLHLLAESNDLMTDSINPPFPLAFIMALVGFICVFFVEKVIFAHHHTTPNPTSYAQVKETPTTTTTTTAGGDPEKYGTFDVEGHEPSIDSGIFAYILTFVLSLHSLISGVALGMDGNLSTLVSLFVAIISHKWIEAFALGVAINKSQATAGSDYSIARTLKLVLIYSAMEPLGIVIGIILSAKLSEDNLTVTQAFVLGLAAGTFIYVAVVDILPAEFARPGPGPEKYIKFLVVLVGIIAISIVVISFSHSHSEDGSDHEHDHDSEF